ncbi:DUF1036 domain-containing protein [Rhizobium laguerreae]|nr:DUF1036 domain-containing protein [Rhizobium laguerreae]MBY3354961.1 DUF1036 domain-containing protein [Rhizobium laguerreae]MBY3376266.1 DUF1036 domain-containing protein [Rhizobium laguerreae]MBY3431265.1 DUF1036 domain-containing protein [Rhizobium laguerreae]MBY3439880.1 DUF1036 domain-containing protein [Rhizobium laguerreae]
MLVSMASAAALLFGSPALAELSICNQTLDVVNVAIGYEEDGEFQTEGWWTVGVHRCADVIRKPLTSRYVYVYAEDVFAQAVVAGAVQGCVGGKRFLIRGVKDCWVRGYEAAKFSEVDTKAQSRWTLFIKSNLM